MVEPMKFESFSSEYKPEIEFFRNLGSKDSYFTALTSNILYLALLHKQFNDKRIFKRLSKCIMDSLLLFKDENLKECLKVYSIIENLINNNNFHESLYWFSCYLNQDVSCLNSFGKFIYSYMEKLKNRVEFGVKKSQIEKTIEAFANFFLVKIEFIQCFDELKICLPEKLPPRMKIPTIFLVKNNDCYGMGFTDIMKKIEYKTYEKGFQSKFFNDIYIYKDLSQPIDNANIINYPDCIPKRGATHSERTHISKLPLSEELKNELGDTYLHCYAITENFNLLVAFTLAFIDIINLPSNKEFARMVLKNFKEEKSMCRVKFNKSFHFRGIPLDEIVENMKEIIEISLHNSRDLEDDEFIIENFEYTIDPLYSQDFMNLFILSKVFGVSSTIVVKDNQIKDECKVILYNASTKNFRPSLHFLAINETVGYRIYVLLTKEYCREDHFDFSTGESGKKPKLINKLLCSYDDIDSKNELNKANNNYKYLIEASNIQNKIISDIMECIKASKPVKIDSNFLVQHCQSLKSLESIADINSLTNIGMNKLRIIENHDNLIQTCHYCRTGDPDFSCTAYCYYHTKCIVEVYKISLRSQPISEQKPSTEIILQCPQCKCKIMELSKFFDESYGQEFKVDGKEYFDKEYQCSRCKNFFGINFLCNISHRNQNCNEKFCIECGAKIIIDSGKYFCKCEGTIYFDICSIKYYCCICEENFMYQDVLRTYTNDAFACKKCLLGNIIQKTIGQILNKQDCIRVNNFLTNEAIICLKCKNRYYKNYNKKKFCKNNCFQFICASCSESSCLSCCICGEPLTSILR
ncbi:hypothetical protein SteCoe_32227 [Stentor coeruleus]|uniref:Uncharacterized protein n=1 Tax=Stentor coeruleus TaxID=5963 RepID=A0A1R2AZN1_9CILI|nr:hypothetical protein SteCoe_32227 [Stentor coeruleus]